MEWEGGWVYSIGVGWAWQRVGDGVARLDGGHSVGESGCMGVGWSLTRRTSG